MLWLMLWVILQVMLWMNESRLARGKIIRQKLIFRQFFWMGGRSITHAVCA